MGKPRMIILIRHAQSEGNRNRDIHQFIPDHRVKLTAEGWLQAEEAGRRLRTMLRPDDTLQFFTSPYRRTRETTEGILRSLTSDSPTPSPFPRHHIKVFEEPRLREQDFGNFQPCSAEMERMWQERADYGHFFYRIPNGESAADAYDRISGFNESMWRLFGEEDFPSVCVLVTHGLMTRVFLMKWYHWSVEYFEDLRNVNHCEFIIMKQNPDNGKYILQNQLRTWSDLKRRTTATNGSTAISMTGPPPPFAASPTIPVRRWGGCSNGCNHDQVNYPRRTRRQNTQDFAPLPGPAVQNETNKKSDHPADTDAPSEVSREQDQSGQSQATETISDVETPGLHITSAGEGFHRPSTPHASHIPFKYHLHPGRDFGGSCSSVVAPAEGFSDDSDYFPAGMAAKFGPVPRPHSALAASKTRFKRRTRDERTWKEESGMGSGARADALGDGDSGGDDEADDDDDEGMGSSGGEEIGEEGDERVEEAKLKSRQGFSEVY
ncbi:uncharacterized protein K452DRAFT_256104 [Aplosporella prunicola CBS 121167]|uniref:Phosphoglycerate mutase-like protein n=1 Tax=Aplosporella prunicola CBS 121167 TaxID=1176127 RepID=A0A6A6B5L6_9PEZI|nr:uncharacterized protein K452DRAFT_256104 [Aplosporella prunicola CBS 121167]KAF2138534.1 hypothetical protein K452DRAFT_256104 [Aplosporella prunicola CBS 121167]